MSSKGDKFKTLMSSPNGAVERKQQMFENAHVSPSAVKETKEETKKKKATFELDSELHQWLKIHAVETNQKMVEIIETLIRNHREEISK